jgi:SPP1 family phage portal protein
VPILERVLANPNKVNNKVPNDFFGDIIDTKQGYMGNQITVEIKKDKYPETQYKTITDFLADYEVLNNSQHANSEMVKVAAISGRGARLLYVDTEKRARIMQVKPWECVWVYDRSIQEPQFAIRYYKIKVKDGGNEVERYRVEWYDRKQITFYLQDSSGGYGLDKTEELNPRPHLFSDIPLVAFPNTEEELGDCDKVVELIDAYDRTFSDVNSEVEQLRLAYMYLKGAGMSLDNDLLDSMKQTGVIPLPEEGDVGFITKVLDDSIIEHHLDRLERNIMRFAKSVDFNAESFGGNMPVIAFQIKIAGLAHKCLVTERLFQAALRRQYTLLATYWNDFDRLGLDPKDVTFTFTRNVPMNLKEEVETLALSDGHVSRKTMLALMSFVNDVDEELRRLEEERQETIDLYGLPPGPGAQDEDEKEEGDAEAEDADA